MKYDVFISYSRKDSEIVKRFADELGKAGYRCWLDVDGVETGDEFKSKIVTAIKESELFLFFSSQASNRSPWTVKEVNVAVSLKKTIIPIKLDATVYNDSLLFDLAGLDFIRCEGSNDMDEAIAKLIRSLGKKIVADKKDEIDIYKKEEGAAKPSNNFWNYFASSTFKVSFRYFVVLLIVVSVGVGAWSSFMVESAHPAPSYSIKSSEQIDEEYTNSNKPAPDTIRGHHPSRFTKERDFDSEVSKAPKAETDYIEKIVATPRSSKGLLCVAAVNKNSREIAYFTADEWESLPQDIKADYAQLGVSISEDGHEFIIALTDCKDPDDGDYMVPFGCCDVEFDRVIQYKKISEFITTGYNDTKNIVEQAKGKIDSKGIKGAPAAEAAWNYKTNEYDNLQWYLPSVSELKMIYRSKNAINNIIRDYIPQGQQMLEAWYCSSTVRDYKTSWSMHMGVGYSGNGTNRYYSTGRVRAVALAK